MTTVILCLYLTLYFHTTRQAQRNSMKSNNRLKNSSLKFNNRYQVIILIHLNTNLLIPLLENITTNIRMSYKEKKNPKIQKKHKAITFDTRKKNNNNNQHKTVLSND